MRQIRVAEEASVGGTPEQVYACLADYRRHHGRFLPPAFTRMDVEEGGVGAGTVISADLRLGGRTRSFRARVEEPEPGRRLTETDPESGAVTAFTVLPQGSGSLVRIETTFAAAGGVKGLFERWLAPRLLRRLYRDELARLDAYVRTEFASPVSR